MAQDGNVFYNKAALSEALEKGHVDATAGAGSELAKEEMRLLVPGLCRGQVEYAGIRKWWPRWCEEQLASFASGSQSQCSAVQCKFCPNRKF